MGRGREKLIEEWVRRGRLKKRRAFLGRLAAWKIVFLMLCSETLALHSHPSPTHTLCLLSLKVLLMISLEKPNSFPSTPSYSPRPWMLQGPRRDRQRHCQSINSTHLRDGEGVGGSSKQRWGRPLWARGESGGCLGLTLVSALQASQSLETGTWDWVQGSQGSSLRKEQI